MSLDTIARVRSDDEPIDPTSDGRTLHEVRRRPEISVEDLAAAVGKSVFVIKNVESGRTRMRTELRDALWDAVACKLEQKYQRESQPFPRLEALVRLCQSKEELARENTMLAQRIAELEARVVPLEGELAELRPTLERLRKAAAEEGGRILAENEEGEGAR